jgi:hypothetical protein
MMKNIDTWYVLADGTHADPADVVAGDDGALKSKNGVAVALRENGLPLTSGVATKSNKKAADEGKKAAAKQEPAKAGEPEVKDMKAGKEPDAGYKTRETKAD